MASGQNLTLTLTERIPPPQIGKISAREYWSEGFKTEKTG